MANNCENCGKDIEDDFPRRFIRWEALTRHSEYRDALVCKACFDSYNKRITKIKPEGEAMDKLKPCPWCEKSKLVLKEIIHRGWVIVCLDCGAMGPPVLSRENANYSWNWARPAEAEKALPEHISRAVDAIIAWPELYKGFPLELAKWVKNSTGVAPKAEEG
jgi:hypothetical protein